ncbi:hypothetical protein [Akkermansia sp.]|uniref:hypothetical protein n=1 Tax=Akkermansia sp. TaxID=1872421 RepID=UPI0025BC7712|nr:hypothetical protein [Akkermansia sp.]MCC8149152.1 hypothetical protein [Akkermansia sp.]
MNFFFCFVSGAALAVAGFISISSAESRIPDVPSPPALRPVSGSLKAGYSTNYEFRGLIPGGCNPTAPVRLDWRSDLNDRYSVILALKEELFLGHPAVDMENETVADLGLQRKFGEASYGAFSFRANDGGLAGFASERLFGNGGTTYETACVLRHDLGFLPGFYVQGSAAYSFYGITGWWFDMCTGSDSRLTENLYMGFKFGAVLSSSYWPSGSNGWQSLYLRVTANYRLFGNIFVEPFVGLHWLGQGAHGVNRAYGGTLVKGNRWVTGVSLVYTF